MELTVVIPALNTAENLSKLLPEVCGALSDLVESFEVVVVCGPSTDGTERVAAAHGANVLQQVGIGYGAALEEGFRAASGKYILTLDADLAHDPAFIEGLWHSRHEADLVISSRYVDKGGTDAGWYWRSLSYGLNRFLKGVLNIDVTDLSSGFRLYRADVVKEMSIARRDSAALVEIVVKAYAMGWRVLEVPFQYRQSRHEQSQAQTFRFGIGFLRTAYHMWRLRNSIACADYDARAYDSRIPLQRYWQRKRCEIITRLARGQGTTLDIACGSSRSLEALKGSVTGLDIQVNKLRYAKRYKVPLANADALHLPFGSGSFDCVVCSQLIEHLPAGHAPFDEMLRVLRPGGRLVLGTPDYGTLTWPILERVYGLVSPDAYAAEHITHYERAGLAELIKTYGVAVEQVEYVFGSEMILVGKKDQLALQPE
ncbi:glycosyltransferase [Chloroflexota bacterium]